MKLDYQTIQEMMKITKQYELEEFVYQGEQGKVTLKSSFSEEQREEKFEEVSLPEIEKTEEGIHYVISEGIGRYYFIGNDGSHSIEVGKEVRAGESIGYVTSIGISTPLISHYSGIVEEILVQNGDIIDFGKKIIKIRSKTS